MKCYICKKEIKSNQSRVSLWIETGDTKTGSVVKVHRKCRDKKNNP